MMDTRTSYGITLLSLMFALNALFGAKVVQLPTLTCGELPNSEVVTNIALNVDYARLENLTFSLELNASAALAALRLIRHIPESARSFSFV